MSGSSLQVRRLALRRFIIIALGGGWFLSAPQEAPPKPAPAHTETAPLRVAAFNVQVFGQTKAGEPKVMAALARKPVTGFVERGELKLAVVAGFGVTQRNVDTLFVPLVVFSALATPSPRGSDAQRTR